MRRMLSMLGASLLFGLATAGTAAANDNGSGPLLGQSQTSSQSQTESNSVTQDASSQATAISLAQLNVNAPVRILSDGNNGSVDQSNETSATSSASNESWALQGIDQTQKSGQTQDGTQTTTCCEGGSPVVDQEQRSRQSQDASNSVDQDASSKAIAINGAQLNVNAPVRVLSDGNDGSVDQSNTTSASSSASNKSIAIQGVEQEQSSTQGQAARQGSDCGCERGGHADPQQSQSSKQSQEGSNSVDQDARSKAVSVSLVQANVNAPIRVLSDGSNGDVDQSNTTSASSSASNKSVASQWIGQDQGSLQRQDGRQAGCCESGGHATWGDHGKGKGKDCGCEEGPVVDQDQRSKQKQSASNSVSQEASSKAFALSLVQPNVNAPIRILSDDHMCGCKGGAGGDVHQSNGTTASSSASNRSWAWQGIDQSQWEAQRQYGLQRL